MAKRKPRQPVAVDHGPNERWQHGRKTLVGVREGATVLPVAKMEAFLVCAKCGAEYDTAAAEPRHKPGCPGAKWVTPYVVANGGVVIDAYYRYGMVTDRQYAAGIRFRAIYREAYPPQAVTAGYGQRLDPSPEGEEETPAERQCRQALAILGTINRETVIDVCVRDVFVGSVLRRTRLRDGLTDLANLWGIP